MLTRARVLRVVAATAAVAGLGGIAFSSFLPWVQSGAVVRNSYQVSGVVARLVIGHGQVVALLLRAWPLLGPVCMIPVVLLGLKLWKTAGGLAAVIGLAAGVLAAGALAVAAGRVVAGVSLRHAGPVTMLVCAGITAVGGWLLLADLSGRSSPAALQPAPTTSSGDGTTPDNSPILRRRNHTGQFPVAGETQRRKGPDRS